MDVCYQNGEYKRYKGFGLLNIDGSKFSVVLTLGNITTREDVEV